MRKVVIAITICWALCAPVLVLHASRVNARSNSTSVSALKDSPVPHAGQNGSTVEQNSGDAAHDGQHDFDFELGSWKIHLKKLVKPLTGSTTWVEFDGTSVTRKVWDGRSQLEEFETDGAAGHLEGLTLRLYNPKSRQWSLYWANSKNGTMGVPTVGEFKNGRGEFYDQEEFNGRMILARFVWSGTNTNTPHFEQSYSEDGGKTWEVNWITDQTRGKSP